MAAASCTLNQLIADSACLNCFSETTKQNTFLYYLAKALKGSAGAADYTNINDLRAAVKCFCVGGQVLDSFKARVAVNAAVNSGEVATTPTIAQIQDAVKCWDCDIGPGERKAMEAFLLCRLLEATVT